MAQAAGELATTELECEECGAALRLGARERTATCPYCRCPNVVERPASRARPNPSFVMPFVLSEERARAEARRWTRHLRLFKKSLNESMLQEGRGLYLPAYLYSAVVEAQYSAEIGENYQETETYTTVENGKTVTRTRTVTRTEWRSLRGEHAAYATDLVVTASRGLHNQELELIEPFDLRLVRRYAPAFVSGWLVEEPSLSPDEGIALARGEAQALEGERLKAFMPGDSYRDLSFGMRVSREALDLVLVPIWVLALRPDPQKPAKRVLVNGQTGRTWGPEEWSWPKILAWIALVAGVIALVVLLLGGKR